MKKNISLKFVIIVVIFFFVGGFIWGKYQYKIFRIFSQPNEQQIPQNIFDKLDNQFYMNFTNTQKIATDTLLKKERTIIFFWSPTCKYCKELYYQINIDTNKVGEIWIPQTDDFEYLDFFIKKSEINKIQIVRANQDYVEKIDAFKIQKIPELWIVDKKGNVIYHQTGNKLNPEFYKFIK